MADDKKKEDQKDEGKKKGLPAIVMIAVGAIVGGAGAVFAIPPKTVEVEKPAPVYENIDVTHPDEVLITFNPRSSTSKGGVSKVGFKFVYTVREDREHEAFERLKTGWDDIRSRAIVLFKTRSAKELGTEEGLVLLEHDLIQTLEDLLFQSRHGGHGEKLATVSRIIWTEILLQ